MSDDEKRDHPDKKKDKMQKKFQSQRQERFQNKARDRSRSRQKKLGVKQFYPDDPDDEDEGTGSKNQFTKFFLRRRREIKVKQQEEAARHGQQSVFSNPQPLPNPRPVPPFKQKALAKLQENRKQQHRKIFQKKRFVSDSQQIQVQQPVIHPLPPVPERLFASDSQQIFVPSFQIPVWSEPPPLSINVDPAVQQSQSVGIAQQSFIADPPPEPRTKPEQRIQLDQQIQQLQQLHVRAVQEGDRQLLTIVEGELAEKNEKRSQLRKKISKTRAQKLKKAGVSVPVPVPQPRRPPRLQLPPPLPNPIPPRESTPPKSKSKSKSKPKPNQSKQKKIQKSQPVQKKKYIRQQIQASRQASLRPALDRQYEPLIRANQPRPHLMEPEPVAPPPPITDADLLAAAMNSRAVHSIIHPPPPLPPPTHSNIAPTLPPGISIPPEIRNRIRQRVLSQEKEKRTKAIQKSKREQKTTQDLQLRQRRVAVQVQRYRQRQLQLRQRPEPEAMNEQDQQEREVVQDRRQVVELCHNGVNDIVYNQKDGLSWIGVRVTRGDHQYFTKNCVYMHHKFIRSVVKTFRIMAERPRPRGTVKQIEMIQGTDVLMIRDYYKGRQYLSLRMAEWSPEKEKYFVTRNGFNLTPPQMMTLIQRLVEQVFPLLDV